MDHFQTILFSVIIFNLGLVSFAIYLVKRSRTKQREQALIRRLQMLEQGKIITAQKGLLKTRQQLLKEKEELLDEYRKILE